MAAGGPKLSDTSYRGLLRNRRFLWYFFQGSSSGVGYAIYAITVPFLAYRITGGFLLPGAVLFVEYLAYSLTFLLGPVVDRAHNKRTILLASYPAMAVIALALGLTFSLGALTPALLLLLVAALSILWDLPWMVGQAAPAWLLPPDALFRSQGLLGVLGGGVELLGYAGGGILLAAAASGTAMYLYAGLLVLATVCSIPLSLTPHRDESTTLRSSFRAGWKMLAGAAGRPLRELAGFSVLRDFFLAAPTLLAVLLAPHFAHPAAAYSTMFVGYIAGWILGGLVLGRWNPRSFVGPLLLATTGAAGALLALGYLATPDLAAVVTVWFLTGMVGAGYLGTKYAYLQGTIPSSALARVIANLYLFSGVASAAGGLALGALATTEPLGLWVVVVSVGSVAAAVIGANFRSLRRLAY
ncbi:MAG: hypothetical protein L3K15_08875 [Thermoplasmata archaeon]|nr:hypothetical protein [Thermoplasmata archaeon]